MASPNRRQQPARLALPPPLNVTANNLPFLDLRPVAEAAHIVRVSVDGLRESVGELVGATLRALGHDQKPCRKQSRRQSHRSRQNAQLPGSDVLVVAANESGGVWHLAGGGGMRLQRRRAGKGSGAEGQLMVCSAAESVPTRKRRGGNGGQAEAEEEGAGATGQGSTRKGGIRFASSSSAAEEGKLTLRQLFVGMVAGGAAGVSVETALYPIDTIKTRLQAAMSGTGIVWKGLYKGLSSNLAGALPASALFVGTYEPVKLHLLQTFPEKWSAGAHLIAAAAGGTVASLLRVPTEVIKQRMQTGQFASATGAVRQILAKEGAKGLYAGYTSFLLRDLPFDAIQFVAYEQVKIAVLKARGRTHLTPLETAVVGASAGALTGAITTPLDVIKTRLMIQGTNIKYKGIFDCVSKMIAEEGVSSLFKGMGPRVLWIGIGGSIFFGVLERVKAVLEEVPAEEK